MSSPQPLRGSNGETPSPHHHRTPSPHHRISAPHFHSNSSVHRLRRFNSLILLLRLVAFCFSLTSAVFMLTNSRGSDSPSWRDFDAFRYVLAANAIVAIYSIFEVVASAWEVMKSVTLFPEALQVWFDFGHDQIFAYLVLSANSAATGMAKSLREGETCSSFSAFCLQSDISIGLGFVGFLFLGFACLLSGYRVVCFLINGSRFHL
ncbi:CASP-like protein 4C2 [Linum grandiflorum]